MTPIIFAQGNRHYPPCQVIGVRNGHHDSIVCEVREFE
jgi:hypothetical protein